MGTSPSARMRWLDYGWMLVALGIGLTSLAFGLDVLASPDGKGRDGMPTFVCFMVGVGRNRRRIGRMCGTGGPWQARPPRRADARDP